MFNKRTRLFVNFNLINFFQILKNIFLNRKHFLKYLKDFLNTQNLVLTSLGRTSLYQIVKLIINKKNKNTFFIAPFTIPAVIHAIIYAGGKIEFIDINKNTGLIDEDELEKKIDNDSAGVIITHLYSNKRDIENFIKRFNKKIYIIEDAAINFGAKINNKFLGTLGDFGFFSFAMVKNLNTFTGGAIYIKDKELFENINLNLKLKKFPIFKIFNLLFTAIFIKLFFNNYSYQVMHYFLKFIYLKKIGFILKKIYPVLYHRLENQIPNIYLHDFNWVMNDVGIYNLKKVSREIEERISKAKLYSSTIKDEVAFKANCLSGENALLEFPIILKNLSNKRAHDKLMSAGYDIRHTWYINNVKNQTSANDFKDTQIIEEKILCLPLHKNIDSSHIIKISAIINTFKQDELQINKD